MYDITFADSSASAFPELSGQYTTHMDTRKFEVLRTNSSHSLQSSNAYEYVSSAPLLPGLSSEVLGSSQENRPLGITLQGSGVCSCCGYLGSVWTFFLSVWLVHPVCWAYASYMFWEKVSDWRPYYDLKSWKVCVYEFCISQTTIFDSETGYLETLSGGFGCLRHSL